MFIAIVRQFHEGMMAGVLDNGDISNDFAVTIGVKEGCVLAPTLFTWCSHPWKQMLLLMILASLQSTEQMGNCSTQAGYVM